MGASDQDGALKPQPRGESVLTPQISPADNGLSMAGKIRTKEKCPKCGGAFTGQPIACALCLTTPRRFFIDLYVTGHGRIKLYSDKSGNPLDSYARASRVIEHIRYEIDQHIFDPTRYAREDLINFLFETRIEAWFKNKENEKDKGNLAESYTRSLRLYKDDYYLPRLKGMDVREIRTYHIQQFYEQIPDSKSLKFIKNIMDALHNFFKWLKRLDFIDDVPSFPIITIDRKTPRWIDRATQISIINEMPKLDRPLFLFLAFQGVRPGEAVALKVKDVDIENERFIITRTISNHKIRERVKSKVVKPRAINPLIIGMLQERCAGKHPEAFVFTWKGARPYTYNRALEIWNTARDKKKVDVSLYEGTRHSLASNLLKDGAALKAISDILGHTDIKTTLKYAHGDIDGQRIAFKRQPEIIALCPHTVPNDKTGLIKSDC